VSSRQESWWLKLDRAEKHFQELKFEVERYKESHPYEAVRIVGGPKCKEHPTGNCWRYRLKITRQLEPMGAVILGDVLYNARSALDHLAVSLVPSTRRSHASFPIRLEDPFAKGSDPEGRRSFGTAIEGMPTEAVAVIKAVQPYWRSPEAAPWNVLALLSRFENADKHRQLILLTPKLRDVVTTLSLKGIPRLSQSPPTPPGVGFGLADDGAQIGHFVLFGPTPPRDSEADVSVSGTPVVAIKVVEAYEGAGVPGYVEVVTWLDMMLEALRGDLVPRLEPFIRKRA